MIVKDPPALKMLAASFVKAPAVTSCPVAVFSLRLYPPDFDVRFILNTVAVDERLGVSPPAGDPGTIGAGDKPADAPPPPPQPLSKLRNPNTYATFRAFPIDKGTQFGPHLILLSILY